jgi:hypothetical protein
VTQAEAGKPLQGAAGCAAEICSVGTWALASSGKTPRAPKMNSNRREPKSLDIAQLISESFHSTLHFYLKHVKCAVK